MKKSVFVICLFISIIFIFTISLTEIVLGDMGDFTDNCVVSGCFIYSGCAYPCSSYPGSGNCGSSLSAITYIISGQINCATAQTCSGNNIVTTINSDSLPGGLNGGCYNAVIPQCSYTTACQTGYHCSPGPTVACVPDCVCSSGQVMCDASGNYLTCSDGCAWTNNGKVNGQCGYYEKSCSSESQRIIKIYSPSNSKGSLWNDANTKYDLCFDEIFGRTYDKNIHDCNVNNSAIIWLSAIDNASAAISQIPTHMVPVCFGNLTCRSTNGYKIYLRNSNNNGIPETKFDYAFVNGYKKVFSGDFDGDGINEIGLYDPATSQFYIKYSNSDGFEDISIGFGWPNNGTLIPVAGDWNGDGNDTIGFYNKVEGVFHLKNKNEQGTGVEDILFRLSVPVGVPTNRLFPVVGNWDSDANDELGLYDNTTSHFYLRNSLTAGVYEADIGYGWANNGSVIPVAGDWNGDGIASIGIFDTVDGVFHLDGSGGNIVAFNPGGGNAMALVGDWDGNGTDTIGIVKKDSCNNSYEKNVLKLSSTSSATISNTSYDYPIDICCREYVRTVIGNTSWQDLNGNNITQTGLGDTIKMVIFRENLQSKNISYSIIKNREGFWGWLFGDSKIAHLSSIGFSTWKANETGEFYFNSSVEDSLEVYSSPRLIVNAVDNFKPLITVVKPIENSTFVVKSTTGLTNPIPFEQISSDPDDLINVHWNFNDQNISVFYNCNNGTSNCNTTHQYNVSYAGTRIVSATAKESTRTQSEYDLSRVYVYKEGLTLFMIIDQPNYRIKEFPPTPIMVNATRTHVANCSRGKTSCEASAGTRICSQINDSINSADSLYCYVYAESSNSRFKFNWTIDNINKPEYPINSSPFEIIFPEGGKHDVNLKVVFNMS